MPRSGLPDGAGLGAKFPGMSAGQAAFMKPEVNHFVLENLAQSALWPITRNAADNKFRSEQRIVLKGFNQERNRQLNSFFPHFNVACRACQAPRPCYAASG
jgi:hypothetical protein